MTEQVTRFLISEFLDYLSALGLLGHGDDGQGDEEAGLQLRFLLANAATEKILLHLFHHGRGHVREIARDHAFGIGEVQRALARLVKGQILAKRTEGNVATYCFNEKNPLVAPVLELVRVTSQQLPQETRKKVFSPKYSKKPLYR